MVSQTTSNPSMRSNSGTFGDLISLFGSEAILIGVVIAVICVVIIVAGVILMAVCLVRRRHKGKVIDDEIDFDDESKQIPISLTQDLSV